MTCTQNSVRSNLLGIQLDNDADLDVLRRALPDAIKFIEPDHKVRDGQNVFDVEQESHPSGSTVL